MGKDIRYEIEDAETSRPHVRLCHRILGHSLAEGFTAVELKRSPGVVPTARAQFESSWKEFMEFPPAVYESLVNQLKGMAGMAPEERKADGKILVRWAGRDASVDLTVRLHDRDGDTITLRFPAPPGYVK